MKIAIVDNNDSFTYNLQHYIRNLTDHVIVFRSDELNPDDLEGYSGIVLSPGPGLPEDFKNLAKIIEKFHRTKPILGICLGHQAIGQYFGCRLKNLDNVYHGVSLKTLKTKNNEILFENIPDIFYSGRYHSWIIDKQSISEEIEITAVDPDLNLIMAISHKKYNVKGVQFHPESIMTEFGMKMIENWIKTINQ